MTLYVEIYVLEFSIHILYYCFLLYKPYSVLDLTVSPNSIVTMADGAAFVDFASHRYLFSDSRLKARFVGSLYRPNPRCILSPCAENASVSDLLLALHREIIRIRSGVTQYRFVDRSPSVIVSLRTKADVKLFEDVLKASPNHPFYAMLNECVFLYTHDTYHGKEEEGVRLYNAHSKSILFKAEDDGFGNE